MRTINGASQHAKPAEQVVRAVACDGLLADLERTRERHRKRPRLEDITHDEAMLAALEVSPHAADDYDPPNVYTRARSINRAEAERMLAFLLERQHGIKNPKFEWKKTNFCITPTGFGGYDDPGNRP